VLLQCSSSQLAAAAAAAAAAAMSALLNGTHVACMPTQLTNT
jgi:hypothetical protein